MRGRVLIVAGSDSGGGAGLQADLKTVTILGGFGMTAVTAITVQNTMGVAGVHPIPLETIAAQIEAVSSDIGVDCVKIGMLGTAAAVHCVADALGRATPGVPRVVDPVMVAKGGHPLLEPDAVVAILERLIPGAALVTPNAPEAESLTGLTVTDLASQRAAAERLIARGARAALVKGGHLSGETLRDVLVTEGGHALILESPRIATRATHGTGCTYASAIAAYLARGASLETAIRRGHAYLAEAIRRAPGLGGGHGPLAHGWPMEGAALLQTQEQ